jgi:type II secretory pathway pseudopilin PulG
MQINADIRYGLMQINKKNKNKSNSAGFTLVEFVIVMAIGIVLATGSFLTYSDYKTRKDLEFALEEVFSSIKSAQKKSVVQENGSGWGIRFNSSITGADSYELFMGAEYSTSSVDFIKSFRRPISFTEPANGRSYDMIFEPRTGKLSEKKIITLSHNRDNKKAGDIIVNRLGKSIREMEDNIVGYWHFDEGVGTSTADASGEGNSGELVNGPTWVSGSDCVAGGCLDFETGVSKEYLYINNSDSLDPQINMTLLAWIYPVGTGGIDARGTIILGSSAYYLSYNDSNKALDCYWYGTDPRGYHSTNNNSVPLNQWSLVSCVWNGSFISQYVDGVLLSTTTVSGSGNKANNIIIGAESEERQFNGRIDEVRIYNTALSSSTIKSIYDNLK